MSFKKLLGIIISASLTLAPAGCADDQSTAAESSTKKLPQFSLKQQVICSLQMILKSVMMNLNR